MYRTVALLFLMMASSSLASAEKVIVTAIHDTARITVRQIALEGTASHGFGKFSVKIRLTADLSRIAEVRFESELTSLSLNEHHFPAFGHPRLDMSNFGTSSAPLKRGGRGAVFEILVPYGANVDLRLEEIEEKIVVGVYSDGTFEVLVYGPVSGKNDRKTRKIK